MTPTPLRVLISGASGFIGTEVVRQLRAGGHSVHTLVRGTPNAPDESSWSPAEGALDPRILEGMDAVINLSGASTGRIPWTAKYKQQILLSRVGATRTLARAMFEVSTPPSVFVSGSAVGIYGDRPGERLTEHSAPGIGFFPEVVKAWEGAAHEAPDETRVVTVRTGIVVGRGGAFTPLIPLTLAGLGTRFGSGRQTWPWISLHDEAAAVVHLLTSDLVGPVNLCGPTPATSDAITRALAKHLDRWYALAIPTPLIGLLGDAGRDLLLTSQEVVPERLLADGFTFRHTTAEAAIAAIERGRQPH